jgi:predicted transcriptional regulator
LLQEAVEHLVAYSEWFERKVRDSMAATERGETVADEEVRLARTTGTLLSEVIILNVVHGAQRWP